LATVVVQDCVVVEVCNAVRHHLLTGPNIEYWLPPIGMLHDQLQRWCCAPVDIEREAPPCADDPCHADVFTALGTGNALKAIGIDTAELDRSLRARAGRAWRQLGSVADLERWAALVKSPAPTAALDSAAASAPGATDTSRPAADARRGTGRAASGSQNRPGRNA
jgi:hypothetical protein